MSYKTASQMKRHHRAYSDAERLVAVERVKNGTSKAIVGRDYGVPESTLRGWCKDEYKIRQRLNKTNNEEASSPRESRNPLQECQINIPISGISQDYTGMSTPSKQQIYSGLKNNIYNGSISPSLTPPDSTDVVMLASLIHKVSRLQQQQQQELNTMAVLMSDLYPSKLTAHSCEPHIHDEPMDMRMSVLQRSRDFESNADDKENSMDTSMADNSIGKLSRSMERRESIDSATDLNEPENCEDGLELGEKFLNWVENSRQSEFSDREVSTLKDILDKLRKEKNQEKEVYFKHSRK